MIVNTDRSMVRVAKRIHVQLIINKMTSLWLIVGVWCGAMRHPALIPGFQGAAVEEEAYWSVGIGRAVPQWLRSLNG
jgi:hypothetical protein